MPRGGCAVDCGEAARAPTPLVPKGATDSGIDQEALAAFSEALLSWYESNGVRLPWRDAPTPYAVLVSEVMLQQTGRDRVRAKFPAFMERFPTLEALAAAPPGAVIRAWSGLGYNRRALRLQQAARAALAAGGLPRDVGALRALPGIGAYTAGAIACFAFGVDVAFVDTNIRRVLRRALLGQRDETGTPREDEALAAAALPAGRGFAWNSALMDLGALHCKARTPLCASCPVAAVCRYRAESEHAAPTPDRGEPAPRAGLRRVADAAAPYAPRRRWQDSDRYLRGRIVETLRGVAAASVLDLTTLAARATGHTLPLLGEEIERVDRLLGRLVEDGLIERLGDGEAAAYRLPA
jgi:A/G-specific adenine glycosylase